MNDEKRSYEEMATNDNKLEKENPDYFHDMIDKDLYEQFEDEELLELIEEARLDALEKAREREENPSPSFPKWVYWLIALFLFMNVGALLPQTFSIPAINFLITSAKLSTQAEIKEYKEAVVVVETGGGRGTGFSVNEQGDIVTNYHVIEGYKEVNIAFPKLGLFHGEVVAEYPEVDLAVVEINETEMPKLQLADTYQGERDDHVYFIGNPLKFQGIANEGHIIENTYVKSKSDPVVMLEAHVYRGNSGSPVINDRGEVTGVVFATMNHDEYGRVGLFIPIDYLHDRYEFSTISEEKVKH